MFSSKDKKIKENIQIAKYVHMIIIITITINDNDNKSRNRYIKSK